MDIENYIDTAHMAKTDKLILAVCYVRSDAILLLCINNADDESVGRPKCDTW